MAIIYIRLVVTIVLVVGLYLSIFLIIKKKNCAVRVLYSVISSFLFFALLLNFSDIYAFDLKSKKAVVIADTLNEKLDLVTFDKKMLKNYEDSFEDDKNRYWIYCAPFDESIFDSFMNENFYSFAYEFHYNHWNVLISPTVYHFDNSYFVGYHETPTQRILCYNEEIIIELQYSSYEYRNEPWENIDFDYVLGPLIG